jgi:YidC/Oxa1 family membrane protein insertase
LLNYLYTAVSFVLLLWHRLFNAIGVPQNSGINWALSIIFLTVTARLILFRFFVKQVHYQRKMQEMQPRMTAIRNKYKDDKQTQQREMMKLQQEEGFNPIGGCLPIFLQFPIFISLFHVLRHLSNSSAQALKFINNNTLSAAGLHQLSLYGFSPSETASGARANLFGAPLAASFHDSASKIAELGGHTSNTRLVILPLLIVSALATMATQLLVKSNQTVVPEGTAATMQKLMLYIFPLGVLASGLIFNFPLGVLLYWFTSNLWTLGQQAYIIRFHPPAVAGASKTGTAATSAVALAPRPGAKPNYAKTRPAGNIDKSTSSFSDEETSGAEVSGTETPAPRTPRPGARPNRPAGRPANKRPNQAKKRR